MGAISSILSGLKNLFTWWITVAPWEQAIRVRGGKRVKLLKSGVHLRVPVIDRFYVQSIRLRTADIPLLTVTTKDGFPVSVAGNLFFEIVDMLKLYEKLHHAHEVVVDIASSALTQVIHGMTKEECTTALVEERATERLDFEEYGINSSEVHITDFAFVKTYRLIMDSKIVGWKQLDTNQETRPDTGYGTPAT